MQKLRHYENITILRPNLNEDDIAAVIDRSKGIIEQFGGNEVQVDRWGLRKLAYLIKKQSQGFYVYTEFAGVPDAVMEMERLSRIDDRVLKFLTVKLDDEYVPGKSAAKKVAEVETEEDDDEGADNE